MPKVQVIRKARTHVLCIGGTDRVVASMPIPQDSVLLGYNVVSHAIHNAHMSVKKAASISMAAYMVGVGEDPDAGTTVDVLFDQQVPKDLDLAEGAGGVSIDVGNSLDTDPFEEPGEVNWNELFGVSSAATKLGETELFCTMASGGRMPHVDTTDEYYPSGVMGLRSTKGIRVDRPSYLLIAVTVPSYDDVTTAVPTMISALNWSLLQFMDLTVRGMLPQVLGMTEAGAESPAVDFGKLVQDTVEPTVKEETPGAYATQDFNVFTKYEVRILVPGEPPLAVVGRQ